MAFVSTLEITRNYTLTAPNGVVIVPTDNVTTAKEDTELINFVSWFKRNYKPLIDCAAHIPNESMKPVQGRVIDAKKGLLDGAPDWLLLSHNVAIEMKRTDKKEALKSKESREHAERQMQVMSELAKYGWRCFMCFGAESAKNVILSLNIKTDDAINTTRNN